MATVNKIDSNVTSLSIAEESTIGVLPGTPIWVPQEPNSYADFGGETSLVARDPINDSRQRKKGVVVDVESMAGFNTDLTASNMQSLLQGYMFATLSTKGEHGNVTGDEVGVDGTTEDFDVVSGGTVYAANDLLFAKGFTNAVNNGLHTVTAAAATAVTVSTNLVTEAGAVGKVISKVGHQFASGDLTVDVTTGDYPRLVSAAFTMTGLGLVPGEFIFVGGDTAGTQFANAVNLGYKRVRSVAATYIELDKSASDMVVDAGAGKTVRIFFGRVLKNQTGSSIVRRTYQLERTLGAPDDSSPAQIQSEYVVGAVPSEFTLNLPTAEKVTCDLSFVALDSEFRSGATGVKSGTRQTLLEEDVYNTSSNVARINLSAYSGTDEAPSPLFTFVTDLSVSINNNVELLKAVSVLGGFDASAGTFEVGASLSAYFVDVASVSAVRNNDDLSLDAHLFKSNKGFSLDMPLCTMGNARPTVEQDQAIMVPLELAAASGAQYLSTMNHTLMWVFYDYLPDLAA